MNKNELIDGLLFAGLRLLAVVLFLIGGLQLVFALADAWYRFDPNYLGSFFFSTVFRPAVLLVAGTILYLFTGPICRCLAKSSTRDNS
jgi:hypothetical protein